MEIEGHKIIDENGHELNIGNRVSFNCKTCKGYGYLGTIVEVVRDCTYNQETEMYDLPYGDKYQYCIGVLWDCHGGVTGATFDVRESVTEWTFESNGTKQLNLFGTPIAN